MEHVFFARLQQISKRKDKLSLESFKDNDKLFVDIVKVALDVRSIRGVTTNARNKMAREKNVDLALRLLEMVSVDTKKIKPKEVLSANTTLLSLLLNIFCYYVNRMIRKYNIKTSGKPAKDNFIEWINNVLKPDREVGNFQSDWMSGMALGALIEKVKPGLCPHWREITPDQKCFEIIRLMEVAEDDLNISKIINPEDIYEERNDELIVMIYLTQFLELTDIIEPRLNPRRPLATSQYYESLIQEDASKEIKTLVSSPRSTATRFSSGLSSSLTPSSPRSTATLSSSYQSRDTRSEALSESSEHSLSSASTVVWDPHKSIDTGIKSSGNETEFWKQIDDMRVEYKDELKSSLVVAKLELKSKLGSGRFGDVHHARFNHPKDGFVICAAKILKDGSEKKDLQDFLGEAWIAKYCNHPNVIRLLYFTLYKGMPCLLFPYMKHGDLLTYLHQNECSDLMLRFAIDVTNGLKYLSDHGFFHRDLAARNCLVTDDIHVVLSDFGLSRDGWCQTYVSMDTKNKRIPWKWTAPEMLRQNERRSWNIKADMWSLGVVFYEIFSKGKEPYEGVLEYKDLLEMLSKGVRLPQPDMCSDNVYNIMKRCWDIQPGKRPSCDEVLTVLNKEDWLYDDVYANAN